MCGRREVGVAGGRWVWQEGGECRHKVWQAAACDQFRPWHNMLKKRAIMLCSYAESFM